MNVLVLTVGDRDTGSTTYRIVQYEPFLREHGIELTYVRRDDIDRTTVARAARCDVLLNQKCVFDASLARRLIAAAPRAIFDVDDAIWTRPGRPHSFFTQMRVNCRLRLWLRRCETVVAANGYLADYARRHSARVRIVGMALDLEQWAPAARASTAGEPVTIGWAGAPGNLRYLEALEPVLCRVLAAQPQARLAVFSGARPALSCPFDYQPFAPGTEAAFTRQLDIGLLPLDDNPHARGKSPIKAIQYLACGVPVVGNVIGATAEIVTPQTGIAVRSPDEWFAALTTLVRDAGRRQSLGQNGRRHAEEAYDRRVAARHLLEILRGAPPPGGSASPAL